ncbi:MAG: PhoU domain-containing protein [Eggerthellaceae bacterium]
MRDVFQQQLALLDAQLLVMASSMQDAVSDAIKVMEDRSDDLAKKVIDGDDDIDRQSGSKPVPEAVLTQQPVAGDLRRVGGLKMVGDIEASQTRQQISARLPYPRRGFRRTPCRSFAPHGRVRL